MDRIILHCDLNNFFASVECKKYPHLAGLPVAVCGNIKDRHGIILAKNETAKKYGVKTAEVVWQAKLKCPDLILLPPHMDEYIEKSKEVRRIYSQYTDLIEPFGIDECWLDVTGSTLLFGSGEEIAYKIKEQIKEETGLTISVGVSFTKIFAKLGSDMKKPDAITVITKSNFKQIVWALPVNDLLGVGKANNSQMKKYGINTIGDLANADQSFLKNTFGKNGGELWEHANGIGGTQIAGEDAVVAPKSIGNSITCSEDLLNFDDVWPVLYRLCESVGKRLRAHGFFAGGIQITVKDNTLHTQEFQSALPFSSRCPKDLADVGMNLFQKHYHWERNIRAVGIRAINLACDDQTEQCNLLYNQEKINELELLEDKIYRLRERFGADAVLRASLMTDSKAPKEESFDETSLPGRIV